MMVLFHTVVVVVIIQKCAFIKTLNSVCKSNFYYIWIFIINVENETERGGFFCFLRHQLSLDWRQDSFNNHLRPILKNAPNINSQQNRHP